MGVTKMHSTEQYREARSRAEAKYQFFVHAMVYVAVIGLLVLINLINWQGVFWSIWPMLGWGVAVLLHAGRVFLFPNRASMIDALTEQELSRTKDHGDGA